MTRLWTQTGPPEILGPVVFLVAFGGACAARVSPPPEERPRAAAPQPSAEPAPAPTDLFRAKVRPLLVTNCAPCHEPGGKMYDRLPFDDPAIVASHREGVLRRFASRSAEDKAVVEEWLKTVGGGR